MGERLSSNVVITRKEHICFGCAYEYPKGTRMQVINQADSGTVMTSYWCGTCQDYWNEHCIDGDLISCGDLRVNDEEGWKVLRDNAPDPTESPSVAVAE